MSQDISNKFNSFAGKLLVSLMPKTGTLNDVFHRAVILVLKDDQDEAIGVDLAHPNDQRRLYSGGPMGEVAIVYKKEDGQVIEGNRIPNAEFAEYAGSFCLRPTIKEFSAHKFEVFKFFVGVAGWGPGQIQSEMGYGMWRAIDATEELVFDTPGDRLYDICAQLAGLNPAP